MFCVVVLSYKKVVTPSPQSQTSKPSSKVECVTVSNLRVQKGKNYCVKSCISVMKCREKRCFLLLRVLENPGVIDELEAPPKL